MKQANLKRLMYSMVAGLFLAMTGIAPAQAGKVVGQITAVDAAQNTITIDGIRFELSAVAVKQAKASSANTLLRRFRPGQSVLFEADNNKLKRIEAVEGEVDFPVLLMPPSK